MKTLNQNYFLLENNLLKNYTSDYLNKIFYLNDLFNSNIYKSFINKKTSYGVIISDILNSIGECIPLITNIIKRPFIIDIEDFFLNYTKYYIGIPSLIDYDNKIVFLNISHRKFIEKIVSLYFYNETINLNTFEKKENFYLNKFNISQIYVDSRAYNKDFPLIITSSKKFNIYKNYFFNILHNNKIKYENNENLEEYFYVLNKISNVVKGKIYFPKANEENIPEGKILVIPTATEEFFLPSLSSMNGNGCIITERGSKTSHIVLMSKEFHFNIVLIENATEKFNDGDDVTINLKDETIIFNY